jgi:hypothetical protein
MGVIAPRTTFAAVYYNMKYDGVYAFVEPVDEVNSQKL